MAITARTAAAVLAVAAPIPAEVSVEADPIAEAASVVGAVDPTAGAAPAQVLAALAEVEEEEAVTVSLDTISTTIA